MLTTVKLEKLLFLLNNKNHSLFRTMLGIYSDWYYSHQIFVETMSFLYLLIMLTTSPWLRMVQYSTVWYCPIQYRGQRVEHRGLAQVLKTRCRSELSNQVESLPALILIHTEILNFQWFLITLSWIKFYFSKPKSVKRSQLVSWFRLPVFTLLTEPEFGGYL